MFTVRYELNLEIKCILILVFKGLYYFTKGTFLNAWSVIVSSLCIRETTAETSRIY